MVHFAVLAMVAIAHTALHEDQRQRCEGWWDLFKL